MIKTVLLDLDDTILDFKMSERVALTKTLNELSIEPTEEIIKKYSKYNISQWKRLELGEISREEVKVNRYKLLFDDIKVDASPEKATAIYEENLAHGHYFVDGAKEMLYSICNDYNLNFMKNLVTSIWQFYVDGFRSMTLGRTLWLIIAIKLFIMFFILRLFFFPNYLNEAAGEGAKEDYVSSELIMRAGR